MVDFSVSKFKSKVSKVNGIARSNLFHCTITTPAILYAMSSSKVKFLTYAATVPGIKLITKPIQRYGYGPVERMPFNYDNNGVVLNFFVDNDGIIMEYFNEWIRSIVNDSISGTPSETQGVYGGLPYLMNYKDEYSTTIEISQYSPTKDKIYKCKLFEAFPCEIGDVNLSWAENNQYSVIPVRFNYMDRYIKPETTAATLISEAESLASAIVSGTSATASVLTSMASTEIKSLL